MDIGKERLNDATAVLWRRLPYMLSPQLDIYEKLDPLVAGKRVLEVGFGTGVGVLQYAGVAEWVDAIEIDPAAVRFAERCFPLPNVNWHEADITTLTGKGYGYDFVVMVEVLEHVHEPGLALDRIKAFLKPGGHALITVPNGLRPRWRREPLNVQEWTPERFLHGPLKRYFESPILLKFDLQPRYDLEYDETPIIALCS